MITSQVVKFVNLAQDIYKNCEKEILVDSDEMQLIKLYDKSKSYEWLFRYSSDKLVSIELVEH